MAKKVKKINKVNILGKEVPVVHKSMEDASGLYVYGNSTIYLDIDIPETDFNRVLIHEMIHALFHRIGLVQHDVNLEEVMVDTIAKMIVENFKVTKL